MNIKGKLYRTVWMEGCELKLIDQTLIPHDFVIRTCKDHHETAQAIQTMIVRGAPAIGATGAYGLVQAITQIQSGDIWAQVRQAAELLRGTRPTAKDLFTAIDCVLHGIEGLRDLDQIKLVSRQLAQDYADQSAAACESIGTFGAALIKDGDIIQTHCNAGWLACVDWGTALAPIYKAHRSGKHVTVYADETRPRCQGSNLTAWELGQEGIAHRVLPDNAGAYYMSRGVNIMIVGADRIAANGDAANKIGTYEKAIVAKALGVPFYVAAPLTTFDRQCQTGADIVIEQRSEDEVAYAYGWTDDGRFGRVRLMPTTSQAYNPAFDVTPAQYITGIITEKGIIPPSRAAIAALFD